MNRLVFLPEALAEVEEATRYYEELLPGLGARFRLGLESVSKHIAEQPLLWRERRGGHRRVNLPGFPYYVAYYLRGEAVVVAAVAHASRHPNYWKHRKRTA